MPKLGSEFLKQHCTVLPQVLERVIKKDHSAALEVMLKTDVDLDDELPSSTFKPLEMACMNGCTHSAAVLIAQLSDQLKGTDRPGILLAMSAKGGHVDIMHELMWKFDIDPQKAVVVNRFQISPIQCAVKANKLESAKLLFAEAFLDTSANAVSQATEDNQIHQAIMHRNKAMLTLLCRKHIISLSEIKLHSSASDVQVTVQQLTKEAIDKHETIKGRFVDTVTEDGKSFRNFVTVLSKHVPRIEESLDSEYAYAAKLPVKSYCDDTLDVKDYSLRVRNKMLVKATEAGNAEAVTKLETAGAYAA
ncbi:MAG: hypothetical protein HAW66_07800 [Shewanella sp.]|nr:hypothetical protein [Shewanella sp.]